MKLRYNCLFAHGCFGGCRKIDFQDSEDGPVVGGGLFGQWVLSFVVSSQYGLSLVGFGGSLLSFSALMSKIFLQHTHFERRIFAAECFERVFDRFALRDAERTDADALFGVGLEMLEDRPSDAFGFHVVLSSAAAVVDTVFDVYELYADPAIFVARRREREELIGVVRVVGECDQ